jgi:hypothetical protein
MLQEEYVNEGEELVIDSTAINSSPVGSTSLRVAS